MSENENDRKESGGNNMDMKRIRKIVGAENLKVGRHTHNLVSLPSYQTPPYPSTPFPNLATNI